MDISGIAHLQRSEGSFLSQMLHSVQHDTKPDFLAAIENNRDFTLGPSSTNAARHPKYPPLNLST